MKPADEKRAARVAVALTFDMAKAAELNGYAGPAHTLEHRDRLGLTPEPVSATAALMAAHEARAREIGAALVDAERRLDRPFTGRRADVVTAEHATWAYPDMQVPPPTPASATPQPVPRHH